MNNARVLIISTKVDVATDEVVRHLRRTGIAHHRLNTEDYPFHKTITFSPTSEEGMWLHSDRKPLSSPSSIWYRRLRAPATPPGMDEGIADFCRFEARSTVLGSILGIRTRWMSHPSAVWQAEHKPFQLEMASRLGLMVPPTIITNDPTTIRDFFRRHGRMIVKPTRTGHLVHQGAEYSVYTSEVLEEHLAELDSARLSPSIYQKLIEKRYDIRVTIVGRDCFSAAIDSQSDPQARIDWRQTANPKLPHHRTTLPPHVQQQLLQLMSHLQLTFGAIDLVQTPSGDYVFLEINPSGQWLWLDDLLDLGISKHIATWLGTVQ